MMLCEIPIPGKMEKWQGEKKQDEQRGWQVATTDSDGRGNGDKPES